jgi:hypothetical protein
MTVFLSERNTPNLLLGQVLCRSDVGVSLAIIGGLTGAGRTPVRSKKLKLSPGPEHTNFTTLYVLKDKPMDKIQEVAKKVKVSYLRPLLPNDND